MRAKAKNIIYLILTFILTVFIDTAVFAEEINGTTGDCRWKLDTGTGVFTIYGNGDMADYNALNPPPWHFRDDIKKVVILSGVNSIGNYSFEGIAVTEVSIPNTVNDIGSYSFKYCKMETLYIPDSVTTIQSSAFSGCTKLTDVRMSKNLKTLGYSVFQNTALKSIVIPASTQTINENAIGFLYENNKDVLVDGFVIYGFKNSYAETYARTKGITFKAFGDIDLSGTIKKEDAKLLLKYLSGKKTSLPDDGLFISKITDWEKDAPDITDVITILKNAR